MKNPKGIDSKGRIRFRDSKKNPIKYRHGLFVFKTDYTMVPLR